MKPLLDTLRDNLAFELLKSFVYGYVPPPDTLSEYVERAFALADALLSTPSAPRPPVQQDEVEVPVWVATMPDGSLIITQKDWKDVGILADRPVSLVVGRVRYAKSGG